MKENLQLIAAPLQGFTEAEWRRAHGRVAGGADLYFSPFMRVERGAVRGRDLRDIRPDRNDGVALVAQAICRDAREFALIADEVAAMGLSRLDLNMGCPFKPQVKHGRGAGLLANPGELEAIADEMERRREMTFSVKMRPGVERADEWREAVDIINRMRLSFITVHPRIAAQMYGGQLLLDEFGAMCGELRHAVVFNGDVREPADIDRILESFPGLYGVMAGRGLLARPTLFAEWRAGEELPEDERRRAVTAIHNEMFAAYETRLCGDSQLLMKIKPYWEYAGADFDRKAVKKLLKAGSLASYRRALSEL